MSPLKQVTIARGTPGEDSFRSTIRRHHQRIARHRRHNGDKESNAPTQRHEKMPLLLRSPTLPTIVVGKDARKRTVSRADGTKTLASRIRTLGGTGETGPADGTSGSGITNRKATASASPHVAGGAKAAPDECVQHRKPSVQPATYTETVASSTTSAPRKRRRGHHRSRRRVIRITMLSKKKLQQRVKGGAKVHKALQTLDKQGLREVLAKNKLVKANTKAPEALLRHIAAGAF